MYITYIINYSHVAYIYVKYGMQLDIMQLDMAKIKLWGPLDTLHVGIACRQLYKYMHLNCLNYGAYYTLA